ncbi:hypothetical protein LINPERPRIM_LOCUS14168 [Linum perenne]
MLNTLVPPLSPPPPTPIFPDQFTILGSGMNSSLILPTSPSSFLDGGEPNQSSGSYYSINDSSPTLLPTTSPKTILNSQEHPGKRLINHYSTDGSSSLLLPTSPNTFLNSRDNQDRSHYSMEPSTPVLPTSPNNLLDFCPSDERLINHYLKEKMLGNEDQVTQIPEVDILSHEPPDLLGISSDGKYNTFAFLVP